MIWVPVIIPHAAGRRRDICPGVHTQLLYGVDAKKTRAGSLVMAQYRSEQEYKHPNDAPIFARMQLPRTDARNHKRWVGEVVLQTFHETELGALHALQVSLAACDLVVPELAPVLVMMAKADAEPDCVAPTQRPWPHAGAPRDTRSQRRFEKNVRTNVHQDTGRPHRDPNCPCPVCTRLRNAEAAPTPDDEEV